MAARPALLRASAGDLTHESTHESMHESMHESIEGSPS